MKKVAVEDCLKVEISDLLQEGVFRRHYTHESTLSWGCPIAMESVASLGYIYEPGDETGPTLRLRYALGQGKAKRRIEMAILLNNTHPHFGGTRWWFTCPLEVDGQPCQRRVTKLFLPFGRDYFGCKVCHDLTYQSCQASHRYDRLWTLSSW